ncbi:MAG TPA: STAS domain-containing protein [Myxococcota bacterium]|nr:STAS domain-containing protein [Myxococcota bacterium]HRY95812.1 STAS domain-containing protein [Myxococcota bacterium]HSA23849.1 STAS domain-containing protein [Myxococcota bacterium]
MPGLGNLQVVRLRGNLLLSLQGELSDAAVNALKETVAEKVSRSQGVTGLIIDVSGIDVMDSYISRTIRDLSVICKLMGVTTVLAGMDPHVAMTLVEMGLDFSGVHTALNLDVALDRLNEVAARPRRRRGQRRAAPRAGRAG